MSIQMGDGGDDFAETHEINVTPFIDVMLVLLIIFMVAAPLATVNIPVDLPSAAAKQQPQPDKPIFLTLKSDHGLVLNEAPTTQETLAAALDQLTAADKSQRIFLRGDKAVTYDSLMQVMDILRDAGYLKVALVAREGTATP
jgi:biopolymer transport protein ExbD